jgi:hypothetical protein
MVSVAMPRSEEREIMSSHLVTVLVSFALAACPMVHAQAAASALRPAHNRQYFRAIAAHHFSVPADASAFALAQELTPWLASPDPELRDTLAYTILDVWIRHAPLPDAQLLPLLPPLQHNLTAAIGESGTDSVFKRSFSALTLASFAERDLQQPFLSPAQYRDLLASALAYLRDERDTRGFDPTKGWIHSTAHTADLLAALARNPHFTAPTSRRSSPPSSSAYTRPATSTPSASRTASPSLSSASSPATTFSLPAFRSGLIPCSRTGSCGRSRRPTPFSSRYSKITPTCSRPCSPACPPRRPYPLLPRRRATQPVPLCGRDSGQPTQSRYTLVRAR